MESVKILVGVALPYAAVLVLLGGMAYRFSSWKKLASPPMTLFPAPADERGNACNTLQEVVLFKSLFKGDRILWFVAWTFHAVLALIFIGHFRVVTGLIDKTLGAMGMSDEAIHQMSASSGGAAGVIIFVTVLLLLFRRLGIPRVAEITGPADYMALALIGIVIYSGNLMRFVAAADPDGKLLEHTRTYFTALATFQLSGITSMDALSNNYFLMHMCLAFLLIMLIPFSKILHLGGIFFTQQLIHKQ